MRAPSVESASARTICRRMRWSKSIEAAGVEGPRHSSFRTSHRIHAPDLNLRTSSFEDSSGCRQQHADWTCLRRAPAARRRDQRRLTPLNGLREIGKRGGPRAGAAGRLNHFRGLRFSRNTRCRYSRAFQINLENWNHSSCGPKILCKNKYPVDMYIVHRL